MTNNPLIAAEGDAAYVLAAIMRAALDQNIVVASYNWPEDAQSIGTPYVVDLETPHGYPYRIYIERGHR